VTADKPDQKNRWDNDEDDDDGPDASAVAEAGADWRKPKKHRRDSRSGYGERISALDARGEVGSSPPPCIGFRRPNGRRIRMHVPPDAAAAE
jgi:hypothetical protein